MFTKKKIANLCICALKDKHIYNKYRRRKTLILNKIYAHLEHVSLQTAYKEYMQMVGVQGLCKIIRRLLEELEVDHFLFKPQYGRWLFAKMETLL